MGPELPLEDDKKNEDDDEIRRFYLEEYDALDVYHIELLRDALQLGSQHPQGVSLRGRASKEVVALLAETEGKIKSAIADIKTLLSSDLLYESDVDSDRGRRLYGAALPAFLRTCEKIFADLLKTAARINKKNLRNLDKCKPHYGIGGDFVIREHQNECGREVQEVVALDLGFDFYSVIDYAQDVVKALSQGLGIMADPDLNEEEPPPLNSWDRRLFVDFLSRSEKWLPRMIWEPLENLESTELLLSFLKDKGFRTQDLLNILIRKPEAILFNGSAVKDLYGFFSEFFGEEVTREIFVSNLAHIYRVPFHCVIERFNRIVEELGGVRGRLLVYRHPRILCTDESDLMSCVEEYCYGDVDESGELYDEKNWGDTFCLPVEGIKIDPEDDYDKGPFIFSSVDDLRRFGNEPDLILSPQLHADVNAAISWITDREIAFSLNSSVTEFTVCTVAEEEQIRVLLSRLDRVENTIERLDIGNTTLATEIARLLPQKRLKQFVENFALRLEDFSESLEVMVAEFNRKYGDYGDLEPFDSNEYLSVRSSVFFEFYRGFVTDVFVDVLDENDAAIVFDCLGASKSFSELDDQTKGLSRRLKRLCEFGFNMAFKAYHINDENIAEAFEGFLNDFRHFAERSGRGCVDNRKRPKDKERKLSQEMVRMRNLNSWNRISEERLVDLFTVVKDAGNAFLSSQVVYLIGRLVNNLGRGPFYDLLVAHAEGFAQWLGENLKFLPSRSLSNVVWGLGQLGCGKKEATRLAQEFVLRFDDPHGEAPGDQETVMVLNGLARLETGHEQIVALAKQIDSDDYADSSSLASCAWALTVTGDTFGKSSPLARKLLKKAESQIRIGDFSAADLRRLYHLALYYQENVDFWRVVFEANENIFIREMASVRSNRGERQMRDLIVKYFDSKECQFSVDMNAYFHGFELDLLLRVPNSAFDLSVCNVEFDGAYYHKGREGRDRVRDRCLQALGVPVVRISDTKLRELCAVHDKKMEEILDRVFLINPFMDRF